MARKTPREWHEERAAKLRADIKKGIKDGSIIVRQMTPAERKQFPVMPAKK